MTCSAARLEANRRNAARSTGPKTEEGKRQSRGNALKHGLSGSGVVLPESDAAEVERLAAELASEMKPAGQVESILVRQMAVQAVRMDRLATREAAAVAANVRAALEDFEMPEGVAADEARMLREEAGKLALFDPSSEAALARKYEAAAQRGFYRALKEFRQHRRPGAAAPAPAPAAVEAANTAAEARANLARATTLLAETNPIPAPTPRPPALARTLSAPARVALMPFDPAPVPPIDIPFTIGRAR